MRSEVKLGSVQSVMKITTTMIVPKSRYITGGTLSAHTDRSHNVPLEREVWLMSNAAAALKKSKVSGLGLMKGERRGAVTGEAVAKVH